MTILATEEIGIQSVTWVPFNAVHAMGVWDQEHQDAFRLWCTFPFRP